MRRPALAARTRPGTPGGPARLSALALLTALAACAVGPDFHKPTPSAPAQWSERHGGPTPLPTATEAVPQPADLWTRFHDPELSRLLERARAANPDLKIAMLHWAQARVQESTVAAQHFPQVSATADAARRRDSRYGASTRIVDVLGGGNAEQILNALSAPYALYRAGFDASWEADLWGRVRRSVEAAGAGTDERAALLRQARLGVAADLARSFFRLRACQYQLVLLHQQIQLALDAEQLLTTQRDAGLIDASVLLRQQQQLAELRAQLPVLQSQEARSTNQISLLVGAQPGELNDELAAAATAPEPALPDLQAGVPSEFVRRRPDIAAAEARLHRATASIGIAAADLYPRITLGATFGLESVSASQFGAWGARSWSIGPALSVPVFDHGRRTATVTLRRLEQQEAAVAYQQTVLQAWHEVDDALSSYWAESGHHAQLADRLRRSEELANLAQIRAAQGLISDLEKLDTQSAAIRARQDWSQSSAQLSITLIALYKAMGDDGVAQPSGTYGDAATPGSR